LRREGQEKLRRLEVDSVGAVIGIDMVSSILRFSVGIGSYQRETSIIGRGFFVDGRSARSVDCRRHCGFPWFLHVIPSSYMRLVTISSMQVIYTRVSSSSYHCILYMTVFILAFLFSLEFGGNDALEFLDSSQAPISHEARADHPHARCKETVDDKYGCNRWVILQGRMRLFSW